MWDILQREFIYIWYYFEIQFRQIFPYWALGMLIGSIISVFGKQKIHSLMTIVQDKHLGVLGIIPANFIGILSPLCMYGTIPIAASFSQKGMRDDYLAAFMMSSVLLNPQLAALGNFALCVRFISCFLCGIAAGLLVRFCFRDKHFFNFKGFEEKVGRDTDPNIFMRLIKNIGRNIKATGIWFLTGVLLSALFQRYVPADLFANLFINNRGFGLLMAATIGVPLYACGGGTIPLLQQWLASGMSMGSASAFMITGPATKITNLGALKIVLGVKHFVLYISFVMVFALLSGFVVNVISI